MQSLKDRSHSNGVFPHWNRYAMPGETVQESIAGARSKWIRANQFFYGRIQRLPKFIVEP